MNEQKNESDVQLFVFQFAVLIFELLFQICASKVSVPQISREIKRKK